MKQGKIKKSAEWPTLPFVGLNLSFVSMCWQCLLPTIFLFKHPSWLRMIHITKQRNSFSWDNSYWNAQEQISTFVDTFLGLPFFIQNQHQTLGCRPARTRDIGEWFEIDFLECKNRRRSAQTCKKRRQGWCRVKNPWQLSYHLSSSADLAHLGGGWLVRTSSWSPLHYCCHYCIHYYLSFNHSF